jgi:hypothetical protein
MACLDNDKRIERIKQGQQRAISVGKKIGGSTKKKKLELK